jgi:hypothetical protein
VDVASKKIERTSERRNASPRSEPSYIAADEGARHPESAREESLVQVDDLTGLRAGNDSLEVSVFAALELAFAPLGGALVATLLLVRLFLSANSLSLAFFHTFPAAGFNFKSLTVRSPTLGLAPDLTATSQPSSCQSPPRLPTVAAARGSSAAAAPITVASTKV